MKVNFLASKGKFSVPRFFEGEGKWFVGALLVVLATPLVGEVHTLLNQAASTTWNAQVVQNFSGSEGAGMLQDPVKPNELYAFYYAGTQVNTGTANHIAKSTDYGKTWTQQIDQTTFNGDSWGAAIDPNPNRNSNTPPTMYAPAGYGQLGLWKSTDGGVHWSNLFTQQSEYQTGLVPQKGGGTVQTPKDNGGAYLDFYQVTILPDNTPNHILVTFHEGAPDLLESTDGGQTWNLHTLPSGSSQYVYGVDPNTWIVTGMENGSIYRTTTAGRDGSGNINQNAWTQVIQDGSPSNFGHSHGFFNVYVDPTNKNIYFPGQGGIICSSDNGANWHLIFSSNSIGAIAATGNYFYASIPYNTTTIFQVPKSCSQPTLTDWQNPQLQMQAPPGWNGAPPVYGTLTAFDGTNWVTVQLSYDGNIWRYTEPATTGQWQEISPPQASVDPTLFNNANYGFSSVAVDPQHPNIIYVGTCQQGIWKSVDFGNSWFKANTGTNGAALDTGRQWTMAIDPATDAIYTNAGYGQDSIWKSTDGGVNWTNTYSSTPQAQTTTSYISKIAVDPYKADHVLATFHYNWGPTASIDPGLVESTDGGKTWTIHNSTGNWNWGSVISFGDNSNTWILGSDNGIWQTTTAGRDANGNVSTSAWQQVSTQQLAHGKSPLYRNPTTGTLFQVGGTAVLKSADNGATWQNISNGLPGVYYSTVIGDGTNLFTAPNFPDDGDNGQAHGPWYTLPEDGSSSTWVGYNSQQTCSAKSTYCNGPNMMSYDSIHDIIYSSNGNAGIWRLIEGGPVATPTPCPGGACPTNTLTPVPSDTPVPSVTPTSGPSPTPGSQGIASVTLVNAQTNTIVATLANTNQSIDGSSLPLSCMNIGTTTSPSTVGSVVYDFDGTLNYHVENVLPYFIGGDNGSAPNCWAVTTGAHTITITPYSSLNGTGTKGTSTTVTFTITSGVTLTQTPVPPTPTLTPIPGDANGDRHVDIFDLSILGSEWQQCAPNLAADFNHDGCVNVLDMSFIGSNWGI